MKGHSLLGGRACMLLVITVVLIAGQGICPLLYYLSSHLAMSAAIVSGVLVVLVKHIELAGSLYGQRRRRFQRFVARLKNWVAAWLTVDST